MKFINKNTEEHGKAWQHLNSANIFMYAVCWTLCVFVCAELMELIVHFTLLAREKHDRCVRRGFAPQHKPTHNFNAPEWFTDVVLRTDIHTSRVRYSTEHRLRSMIIDTTMRYVELHTRVETCKHFTLNAWNRLSTKHAIWTDFWVIFCGKNPGFANLSHPLCSSNLTIE